MTATTLKSPRDLYSQNKLAIHDNLIELLKSYNDLFGETKDDITLSEAQELAHFNDLIDAPLYYLRELKEKDNKNQEKEYL